uniref:Uncharacterized protein n=1 Tax=Oryza rufipogon TaxID=4529 RepID=A0A0E0NXR1_ORYRU
MHWRRREATGRGVGAWARCDAARPSWSAGQDGIGRSNIMEAEGILKDLIDDKVNNVDAELHVLQEEHEKDLLEHDRTAQKKRRPRKWEAQSPDQIGKQQ